MSVNNILFLLKQSDIYGNYSSSTSKSGLLNSARITGKQITKYLGIPTNVEVCVDGNEIDKYVHKYKPRLCIIEALWATPTKMIEVTKLHPKTIFVILLHSNVPFLSNEGIAVGYIKEYVTIPNVFVGFNSFEARRDFKDVGIDGVFLPNVYDDVYVSKIPKPNYIPGNTIDAACFGAIRPFKNQLLQAMAAIVLANYFKAPLRFHINSTRPEQGGQSTLKNIRELFKDRIGCTLVEHDWEERDLFLQLVKSMDIGMQVSFSETFNIVAADFVKENVPCVVSSQIEWMPLDQQASLYEIEDIVCKMINELTRTHHVIKKNVKYLSKYNTNSLGTWNKYLKTIN
jgi:hypothetical protein